MSPVPRTSGPEVMLCIPPDYERTVPPLGTPALLAFLRSKGLAARQVDLNIRYRDFLAEHVTAGLPPEAKLDILDLLLFRFFARKLRNRYYSRFLIRDKDPIFPYIPYSNNTNSSFHFCERLLSSPHLHRYLQDEKENTFLQFFRRCGVLYELKGIGLLGISITSPSQAVASLTLGLLVKKTLPEVHVVIGGQWPTLFRRQLRRRGDLFDCFDSIIVFEGETPLCRLAQALRDDRPLAGIANLISKHSPVGEAGSPGPGEDLDRLPCPDYDGLDLRRYDAFRSTGEVRLAYESSRGCYWSRCAYCVDLPIPRPSYREKPPASVAKDLQVLQEKFGARSIVMSDPGMSPRQMLGISRQMLRRGLKMKWWTMARLDEGFTGKVFRTAAEAGLVQINFGFESACDKVCAALDKGNTRVRSERIIRLCAEAGIRVNLQTMVGLPNETFSDALETVDFLMANKDRISDVTFNLYYLTPANRVYLAPRKYGIRFHDDPRLPFRFFHPFQNVNGLTPAQAASVQTIYACLRQRRPLRTPSVRNGIGLRHGAARLRLIGEEVKMPYTYDSRHD